MVTERNKQQNDRRRMDLAAFLQLAAISLLVAVPVSSGTANAGLPAFPGAEGAGALAVGGRGGVVCKVTNLNDSGPGSLRACVEMSGPRTVVFEVGGTISLDTHLWIRDPYLTIAGQTAPGDGIQIKASGARPDRGLIVVSTRDVVIRYLRIRRGTTGGKSDTIRITDTGGQLVQNVIFDHVSSFWTENQNWSINGRNAATAPRNITLQNSILAEPINNRVQSLITPSDSVEAALAMSNIDMHHNFLTGSSHRNPSFQVDSGRFVNNIVYHARSWWSRFGTGSYVDLIGNKYKRGPEEPGSRAQTELHFMEYHPGMLSANEKIQRFENLYYVVGNWGEMSGMRPNTDNWPYTRMVPGFDGSNMNSPPGGVTPEEWRRHEPLPPVGPPITVRHVDDLENHLLPIVGASRRLDCEGNWVFNRDAADARVIDEYLHFGGVVSPRHEDSVGGFPQLAGGSPCLDTSGDGIPDQWAIAHGFDPTDPSLGSRLHESGFTYLEIYLGGVQMNSAQPAAPRSVNVE